MATLALAGKQYGYPSTATWQFITAEHPYILVTLIAVVGVFGVLTPFEALTHRIRVQRQVVIRGQILTTFGQLLEVTSKVRPTLAPSDPALHVWQRRRTLRHPAGELIRIATYRLGSTPMTRSLRPARGIGVVGLCWKRNHEVGLNILDLAQHLTDESKFATYRQQNGPDAVMGFSWPDFERYRHRGAVFASPVRNGRSKFIGCVSFDASHGYDQLDCARTWHELNSLCHLLGQDELEHV
ncbi:hypothetical protein [Nonomuraea sp. NPDC048826]|uniref:hypothetical protein n=1 Tax=Nonomuraea sp. NPDC048826 TaxID=3364347 RepID=UPI003719DFB4